MRPWKVVVGVGAACAACCAAPLLGGLVAWGDATVRRLAFVRRCRDFGFSIEQVRELVGLVDQPERPCAEARDVAAGHLAQVRRKLEELRALEASLAGFVDSCEAACAGGAAIDCTILEALACPRPTTEAGPLPLLRAHLTHRGPCGAHSESEMAIRPKAQKITKSEYP